MTQIDGTGDMRISEVVSLTGLSARYWQRQAAANKLPGVRYVGKSIRLNRLQFMVHWQAHKVPVPWMPDIADYFSGNAAQGVHLRMLERSQSAPSWVYFILCGGLIKIGYSARLRDRINSITVDAPSRPYIIGLIEGDRDDEREYQRRFRDSRHHGEWYKPTPHLTRCILREAQP